MTTAARWLVTAAMLAASLLAATAQAADLAAAQAAYDKGDYATAAKLAAEAGGDAGDARAALLEGKALMRGGELEPALAALDRAAKGKPPLPGVQFFRGTILGKLGRHQEAEKALRAELVATPGSTQTRMTLALVLRDAGRKEDSAKELLALLEGDPGDVKARKLLATTYQELGRLNDAALHLAELPKSEEDLARLCYNVALELYEKKQDAKAAQLLRTALSADKAHAKTWYLLGLVRLRQGNPGSARENFEKFLAIEVEGKEADEARRVLASLPPASS